MADEDPIIRISAKMPRHPKIIAVGGDAAWLLLCSIAHAREYRTDGIIKASVVPSLSDRRQPQRLAKRLIEEHLWHEPGHDCKDCAQPLPGSYIIHDYLDWQQSAARQVATKAAKEAGGAYGNHRRWHVVRNQPDPSCEFCASHMRSDNQVATESHEGSHMRSVTDPSSNPSTESDANRISDESDPEPPPPPHTPPSPRVDITPPTPPSANGKQTRRQAYDYAADQDFLRFWDAFPQKSGKPAAYRAWLKALARDTDPETIIAAAKRYHDDPRRDPDHTKYPQGWLNDERYLDTGSAASNGNVSGRIYEF